eukprot:1155-Heterococcus_DN1.PRE.3
MHYNTIMLSHYRGQKPKSASKQELDGLVPCSNHLFKRTFKRASAKLLYRSARAQALQRLAA